MLIRFKAEGDTIEYFQYKQPLIIDTDQLCQEEASELKGLVAACSFFDLPPIITNTSSQQQAEAHDLVSYTLTIEISRQSHTLWVAEPIDQPSLRGLAQLITYLKGKLFASSS